MGLRTSSGLGRPRRGSRRWSRCSGLPSVEDWPPRFSRTRRCRRRQLGQRQRAVSTPCPPSDGAASSREELRAYPSGRDHASGASEHGPGADVLLGQRRLEGRGEEAGAADHEGALHGRAHGILRAVVVVAVAGAGRGHFPNSQPADSALFGAAKCRRKGCNSLGFSARAALPGLDCAGGLERRRSRVRMNQQRRDVGQLLAVVAGAFGTLRGGQGCVSSRQSATGIDFVPRGPRSPEPGWENFVWR